MTVEKFKTLKEIKEQEKEKQTILKLKDADIVEIETDSQSYSGCETCDYGSEYITEAIFTFSNGDRKSVSLSQMYSYVCSEADLILFFVNNLEKLKETTWEELEELFDKDSTAIELFGGNGW